MDRYGNVLTTTADTVALGQLSGPSATFSAAAALSSGQATLSVTYAANGTSLLNASGRRLRGQRSVEVAAEATVAVNGGDNQAAMAGSAVPAPLSVLVRDLSSNPLAGVPVTFSVTSGGGYLVGATAVTNASGVATLGKWVLGSPAALNTLTATAAGAAVPAAFTASGCGGGGGTGFGITLCYRNAITPSQRAAFDSATARWEEIITTDLPDVTFSGAAGTCWTGSPSYNLTIDDLLVFVSIDSIDGTPQSGTNLGGFADVCYVRTGAQPFVAYLRLDSYDITTMESSGRVQSFIKHELGHTLGLGTLWPTYGLVVLGSDPHYTGTGGIVGFNLMGGNTYTGAKVPTDAIGGHWREAVFGSELMTPSVNTGAVPISQATVRALTDIGYTVDTSRADALTLTLSLRSGAAPAGAPDLSDHVGQVPLYSVDARGRVIRIR
jgi:hypothetical protein